MHTKGRDAATGPIDACTALQNCIFGRPCFTYFETARSRAISFVGYVSLVKFEMCCTKFIYLQRL